MRKLTQFTSRSLWCWPCCFQPAGELPRLSLRNPPSRRLRKAPAVEPTKPPEPTSPPEPTDTVAPPEEPTEKILLTYWLDGNDLAPVIQENIIDPFNAQSETISSKPQCRQSLGCNAHRSGGRLRTRYHRYSRSSFAVQLAWAGYLLPLDDLAEQ